MTKTRAFLRESFKKWWCDGSVAQRKTAEKLAWLAWIQGSGAAHPQAIPLAASGQSDGLAAPPSPAQPAAWPVNLDELHDPDLSDGLTASQHLDVLRGGPDPRAAVTASPGLPPRVGHVLRLAEIIREVDGKHELGAAALAEAILAHPGFSGCYDGPAAQLAPGFQLGPQEYIPNA